MIALLGKRIKQMRIAAGFSQAELAARLGIAQTTLSGYETGYSMPNYDVVERLAKICEFDVIFLDKNSAEKI
ncbi:MAG: helix-turn-helix domain-containing protein [Clostridiales bacterium]|nr:helix-turn-helix domain-containing protein [Clostridiales bacterium]